MPTDEQLVKWVFPALLAGIVGLAVYIFQEKTADRYTGSEAHRYNMKNDKRITELEVRVRTIEVSHGKAHLR